MSTPQNAISEKNFKMEKIRKNTPIPIEKLEGVYTALITPMFPGNGLNNAIDYSKMQKLIDNQVRAGINGIVVAGTTGQTSTLLTEEHISLVENIFDYTSRTHPQLQFIVGAGSNSTQEAINLSRKIEERIGPSTFLHVTGYYNNPPQEGITEHFIKLAQNIPESSIILYNVPTRTGSNIEPETAIALGASIKNIIGIKEASGDMEAVKKIIQHSSKYTFRVLSGEDDLVAKIMQEGGTGVISASANIAPKYFVDIARAALNKDYDKADRLQYEVLDLVKQGVFYRKNPIPLAHMFNTEIRLPLIKLPKIQDHLQRILSEYSPENLGINLEDYK